MEKTNNAEKRDRRRKTKTTEAPGITGRFLLWFKAREIAEGVF